MGTLALEEKGEGRRHPLGEPCDGHGTTSLASPRPCALEFFFFFMLGSMSWQAGSHQEF